MGELIRLFASDVRFSTAREPSLWITFVAFLEDAFWAELRGYTRQHAGGTVTSIDFERSMEKATGRDLTAEFAEWVFGPSDAASSGKPHP